MSSTDDAVLLTGATGFIGGALLDQLVAEPGALRLLVRDPARLRPDLPPHVTAARADLSDPGTLAPVLEGIDVAFYLVHSMEPGAGAGFADRDRAAAENYARCAQAAGVRRTIYLGGIAREGSEHLRSRLEVERILGEATPEFVSVRASMVVGAGSGSFGAMVQLVDRLPLLPLPPWRDQRTSPVAVDDVVAALRAARTVEPGAYEVAGPDSLTFAEMTEVLAGLLGKPHRTVDLPFSDARLEAGVASVITDGDRELLEPLFAGLHEDLRVDSDDLERVFGVTPTPFVEAARRAMT